MVVIIALQRRILMYYCYQYCSRCRSGGILAERFERVECPGARIVRRECFYTFLYISLAVKGHTGLVRAAILASNIACLYGELETGKGAKSDF